MLANFFHITLLAKRLCIALLLYTICRILFLAFNLSHFEEISPFAFVAGLRFDLVAIAYTNALFIALSLIPFTFREKTSYQNSLLAVFLASNSIGIAVNCIDFIFFRFTLKRSTADLFKLEGMQQDVLNLLPQFILDYWFIPIIWLALMVLAYALFKKTIPRAFQKADWNLKYVILHLLILALGAGLTIVATRGGIQEKPISVIAAGKSTIASNVPLVLNTAFTLIKTLEYENLEPRDFLAEEEALAIFNPVKLPAPKGPFKKKNVVIILMESFSAEYTAMGETGTSYTPFLDSLMQEGLLFTNAYANGKGSIEGIPSVIASMPSFMPYAFITSPFSVNKITSFASLLKDKGYYSTFFHGGNNGTMGLDDFIGLAGFDKYYGRNEYGIDKKNINADYDGYWGIWDEAFFDYYAEKLKDMPEPFVSSFFSLSSHHPFAVPEKYKNILPDGTLEIHKSISYADLALRKFFDKAKTAPWFKNTLFVITADHTGLPNSEKTSNRINQYWIPVLFYNPGQPGLKGINDKVIQQIDILPTVMDYLDFDKPFFSYGQSAFNETYEGFALSQRAGTFQMIKKNGALVFDGAEAFTLQDYVTGAGLPSDTARAEGEVEAMKKKMQSFLQVYTKSMIDNKQSVQ
jgi:phosphoglycerol transferase MdoB-like AlkP superfamily enzyme